MELNPEAGWDFGAPRGLERRMNMLYVKEGELNRGLPHGWIIVFSDVPQVFWFSPALGT